MNEVKVKDIEAESLSRVKILYVEDEEESREELYEFLKRRVGKIYTADSGAAGIRSYEEHKPHIIIADLYMPEMGGIDMIKHIKNAGGNPYVIITSAVDETRVILEAVDAGINKYIIKPINVNELLEELNRFAMQINHHEQIWSGLLPDQKKLVEGEIKQEFASLLKRDTGKGPKDVTVFIDNTLVEITASSVLTPLEKTLIDRGNNSAIIIQNRRLFYEIKNKKICDMISKVLKSRVKVIDIIIDIDNDKNKIIFGMI